MPERNLMHVLVVAGRGPTTDWVVSTLRTDKNIVLAGWVPTLERAIETAGQRQIDLILLETSVPDAKQLERLQTLAAAPLSPAVILLVEPDEVAFVQQALFAGARGFLLKPFTEQQLTESLHQTHAVVLQQRQALSVTPSVEPRQPAAEILAVFSPKGGIGRTSLATNLAIALHQEARKRVTLIDGDLQFGDVDIAVNAIAHTSIADLLGYVDDLEPSLIESALVRHPTGIRLLLAPAYFDPTLELGEGRLSHVIKSVATAQDGFVVIDMPSNLDENTLGMLDVANHVLLVAIATLSSLRATKRFLELAAKLGYPPDKVNLVLSGYRKDVDIPVADIERHLNWPVMGVVPSDPAAMSVSISQGQPIICRDKNHAVSKAIAKLARQLAGETSNDTPEKLETTTTAPSMEKRAASPLVANYTLKPKAAGT